MEKRKRPVHFKAMVKTEKGYNKFEGNGLLIGWGTESEEHEQNYGNFTVAIIEGEGGKVFTAMPKDVVFTDVSSKTHKTSNEIFLRETILEHLGTLQALNWNKSDRKMEKEDFDKLLAAYQKTE